MYFGNYTQFDNYRVPKLKEFVLGFNYEALTEIYITTYKTDNKNMESRCIQEGPWKKYQVGSGFEYPRRSVNNMLKEGRIRVNKMITKEQLSHLSLTKHVLTFVLKGHIIKLLPPIKGKNYYTYEGSVYVNGTNQTDIGIRHAEWPTSTGSIFSEILGESNEDIQFKECWNYLIYSKYKNTLQEAIKLRVEEDVLWKYFVYAEPWNKYLVKHSITYVTPDMYKLTEEVEEINKHRVRLSMIHKTLPIKTNKEIKGIEIINVIRL